MRSFTPLMEKTTALTVNDANEKTRSIRNTVNLHFLLKNFSGK
jgi:hypothetical protein